MKREELRLMVRALKGEQSAINELERLADSDERWNKWRWVKTVGGTVAAAAVIVSGIKATIETLLKWKD